MPAGGRGRINDGAAIKPDRPLAPMLPTERGSHLLLHRPPNPFEPGTHPGLSIPEDAPLPDVPRVGLEVQLPRNAAASESPIKRLAVIFSNPWKLDIPIFSGPGQPPLHACVAFSAGGGAVRSHAQMLGRSR